MGAQIHSVPAVVSADPCEVAVRAARPALRGHVLGYSGFRSCSGRSFAHLLLPIAYVTVVIDFASPSGLVTGARDTATAHGETVWGHGVSAGFTPLGAAALLGLPMGELGSTTVALADLLGPAATELPGLLGAAPTWQDRFDLIDAVLAAALAVTAGPPPPARPGGTRAALSRSAGDGLSGSAGGALSGSTGAAQSRSAGAAGSGSAADSRPGAARGAFASSPRAATVGSASTALSEGVPTGARLGAALGAHLTGRLPTPPDRVVTAAWRRLQQPSRPGIAALAAELGVTRRSMERSFQTYVGMSPATVARIARFQRVVEHLGNGATLSAAAAGSGYSDHPHLARETRSMAGLTPTQLGAFVGTPPVFVA